MKNALIAVITVGLAAGALAAEGEVVLKDQKDKMSYSLGVDLGRSMTNSGIQVNVDAMAAGIRSIVGGGKALMSDTEVTNVMNEFRTEMRNKQMERMKKAQAERAAQAEKDSGKNKQAGEAFLAENKKKPGVQVLSVTLPDGKTAEMQYKVITMGKGPKPTAQDTVVTHYRGTLIDGTEFDSSYKRGEPASFPVGGVIKGWTEALKIMPVGSKWQLFIPSELAYGNNGAGNSIPPGATLLFDIELISIQEKK